MITNGESQKRITNYSNKVDDQINKTNTATVKRIVQKTVEEGTSNISRIKGVNIYEKFTEDEK